MNIFITHPDLKNQKDTAEEHPIIHYEQSQNMNAGEFLDDSIRMHDQPLADTVKSIGDNWQVSENPVAGKPNL